MALFQARASHYTIQLFERNLMSKGDHDRVQNQINTQGGTTQNTLNNSRGDATRQNQGFENHYNTAYDQNYGDYLNQGQQGNSILGGIQNTPLRDFQSYGGYQNFTNTGGYSPEDIQAIRERSNAPINSEYASAKANLDRQKALTGGYMPNYAGALGRMTREQSIAAGNQSMNTEAALADQIRQGKLAGLSGMTGIDSTVNNLMNQRMSLGNQAYGNILQNYSATPGQASMAGQQMNTSSNILQNYQQLQQQLAELMIKGQLEGSKVPGDYQQALGNIGSTIGLVGNVAGALSPFHFDGGRGTSGMGNTGYTPNDQNGWG
jgi:hypothetical protein